MHTVTLTTDGRIHDAGQPLAKDPIGYLSYRVALADGYTLRSLFHLLMANKDLGRLSAFWPACMALCQSSPEAGCVHPDFAYLELSKTVEMIGFPGTPSLEIYMAFQGVMTEGAREIRFVPLESLLDMPVCLGPLKHIVFGDKMDVFMFETVYTLFEFIDGILWELSFHGTPAQCEIRR